MNLKYFKGQVPGLHTEDFPDLGLAPEAGTAIRHFKDAMSGYEFHKGLEAIWQFISHMNKYIDTHEPWALAKDPEARPRLEAVIRNLLEGLRTVAGLIYPVMPETSRKMLQELKTPLPESGFFRLEQISTWAQMPEGTCLAKPDSLFPRVDVPGKPTQ